MPSVRERKIYRLNEEVLYLKLLPAPWAMAFGVGALILFMVSPPRTVPSIITLAASLLALGVTLVVAYRVFASKKLVNLVKWHDAGIGGVVGRDLNPVPHRYQPMTAEESLWLNEAVKKDRQRAAEAKAQHAALRREEGLRQRTGTPGRNV